jgi:glucosamine--fructose-6-phosphate aminotransferase (isomerizing)
MNSGPEICVLSTKTYTSQIVLMALLAHALVGEHEVCIDKVKKPLHGYIQPHLQVMRDHLKELARLLADQEHLYMIGRGLQYTTALEAALKVKEVSYIHTEAFAAES